MPEDSKSMSMAKKLAPKVVIAGLIIMVLSFVSCSAFVSKNCPFPDGGNCPEVAGINSVLLFIVAFFIGLVLMFCAILLGAVAAFQKH
ncbi:hypothetical protein HYU12_04460 [Candidatus Woesearchaeota archaeon]|nr:hypothetical protein [Candidatus Woesearchaeota archaeon]